MTLEIVVYSRHQFQHPTVCWARKMSDPLHTPCILLERIILLNGSGKPHTPLYLTTPGNHLRPGVLGPGVGVRIPLPFPSAGPVLVPYRGGHSHLSDCHTFTNSPGCVGRGLGSLHLCIRRASPSSSLPSRSSDVSSSGKEIFSSLLL